MSEIQVRGSGHVFAGKRCSVASTAQVLFSGDGILRLADYVTIGDNVKIIIEAGEVHIGDWTTLHAGTTLFSKAGINMGAHCWFGQHSVVDGTGGLTVERGVRVGMFSQIWTHVAAGEQIEGCTLFAENRTHIERDVWLVGTCTVGSGVRIGERTIALAGSNIVSNCLPGVVVAGAPAKVKDKLSFYKPMSLVDKMELLRGWMSNPAFVQAADVKVVFGDEHLSCVAPNGNSVIFFMRHEDYAAYDPPHGITPCCLETKAYVKKFTSIEYSVMKYLAGNKARFYSND